MTNFIVNKWLLYEVEQCHIGAIQWEPEDYQTSIELIGCDIVDKNSPTTTKQRVELSVD